MPSLPASGWVRSATDSLTDDARYQRVAGRFGATVLLEFGDDAYVLEIEDGDVTEVDADPSFASWDFAVRAPVETWETHFAEVPPPQYNDLRSLWLQRDLTIEGDVLLAMQHWRSLKLLIDVLGEAVR